MYIIIKKKAYNLTEEEKKNNLNILLNIKNEENKLYISTRDKLYSRKKNCFSLFLNTINVFCPLYSSSSIKVYHISEVNFQTQKHIRF